MLVSTNALWLMAAVRSSGELQSSPLACGACCWTRQGGIEGPALGSHILAWAIQAGHRLLRVLQYCSPGVTRLQCRMPARQCNMLL